MPTARSVTVIRDNVFAKPEGGTAEAPRPNVLVGHFPLEGAGHDDQYVVYGNFFYQNRLESLFQGEGNVAIYGNLFVNAHGDGIRIQPHNDIPRRIDIAFNTVLARNTGSRSCRRRARRHSGTRWLRTPFSRVSPSPAARSRTISRRRWRTRGYG